MPSLLALQFGYNFLVQSNCLRCFCSFNYSNPVSRARWQNKTENKVQGLPERSGRFVPSEKVLELGNRLIKFMEDHIYPMENEFNKRAQSDLRWTVHPEEEKLKELAKKEGLWNLWLPVCITSLLFKLLFPPITIFTLLCS